jgi:hypothetical protein
MLNVIFTFNTTSVDPATTSYPVTKYTSRMNTYSNSVFFNTSPTRPAYLNTTDQATYVQFQGMFQFVSLFVSFRFIPFWMIFFPFLTTGCYQFSTSCDICPTTAFGKWSKLQQQFSNVHCWYLTNYLHCFSLFTTFLIDIHFFVMRWLRLVSCWWPPVFLSNNCFLSWRSKSFCTNMNFSFELDNITRPDLIFSKN